jgi:hypothetical protein
MLRIVSWRLRYAFIEKEECSKEEEAFGQNWEMRQLARKKLIPYPDYFVG